MQQVQAPKTCLRPGKRCDLFEWFCQMKKKVGVEAAGRAELSDALGIDRDLGPPDEFAAAR